MSEQKTWSIVYEKAVREDGSLFFPQRLSKEFLSGALRTMGTYLFSNQYQNEVIPDESRVFRKEWFKYYDQLPDRKMTFAFIDPAIGQKKHHDYTATVVIDTDVNGNWYVRVAKRERLTPTQIVNRVFDLQDQFKCQAIGVESVAFQKMLLYMVSEEMRKRKVAVPLKEVIPGNDISKEMRISGLQPRLEWGSVYLAKGLNDLEMEFLQFPRGSHDDLIDALSHIESIVQYPEKEKPDNTMPHQTTDLYEKWYRDNILYKRANDNEE